MPYSILKQVYNRGMEPAWKGGHRPELHLNNEIITRVNSFVTKSSNTWDSDLAKKVRSSKKKRE